MFWDVKSKELVQSVSGHEGVVIWVDTSPAKDGVLVSGGLDGTVRIWVDVNEYDDVHINGLADEYESGITPPGEGDEDVVEQLRIENRIYGGDTERDRTRAAGEDALVRGEEEQTGGLSSVEMQS